MRHTDTVYGIGPGGWDIYKLTRDQQEAAQAKSIPSHAKTLYRIHTEDVANNGLRVRDLVRSYFEGATITFGIGLDKRTQLADEPSVTIDIVTSHTNGLAKVLALAGAIRRLNHQISVLVVRIPVDTYEVTEAYDGGAD